MARGNIDVYKVFYKGDYDNFVVFVEDVTAVRNWKKDRSIPLAQVVNGFKIYVTHRQGAQGIYDGASKSILESEFGTSNEDEVISKILEKGEIQETENHERNGTKNDSKGIYIRR
ncbi:RNA binding protein [Coccidioides immitis RS]|uniref:RNA binding protein n=6 Tax=Coccidioides TaxID=5500 RepID=A0A0E1RV30_COCIM|nr:RNA binding protein [Coccidioides immitis RS]XP_003072161.1 hypothetical protein CPC735_013340 [Coccidioides posadasii C735 delta SOWgp]EFW19127.1 RNA binding protein [Coccidioides posadasii str. Silveira]KMM71474.1 hypothetical protein CPAG_07781 [Coccidioides posadasii RMSCC 3488]KMP09604.1 hypothetical protein CIRG_09774 [Coccidioides immitis RMSCC 2394]KMU73246.1 hypothetical protein CISG_09979 [Coccidioides immitis RMSCC 3703]EAS27635.1 RNA binding protein [Coccidioides immitis RS]|eukprot:XP_003072161.1 hypothetical protein CPC735_013340 [Coccidioides posadasii C735 delta SOWgp]